MNEFDVVIDVRPSPDTPELIVMKQKLVADTSLHLVGQPREERVGMGLPRVKIAMGEVARGGIGYVMTAKVTNVGLNPIEIKEVSLVFDKDRRAAGEKARPVTTSFRFEQLENATGTLPPAHSRSYYLSMEMYEHVAQKARAFRPDDYRIAVFMSDREEIGSLPGKHVAPFLDRTRIKVEPRAEIVLDGLSEVQRIWLMEALGSLVGQAPSSWPREKVRRPDPSSDLYLVRVLPNFQAVIAPSGTDELRLLDLVHDETLKQFETSKISRPHE